MSPRKRAADDALEIALAVRLLSSPVRVRIVEAMAKPNAPRHQSPSDVGAQMDASLGNVAYHFRTMEKAGILEQTNQVRVRGTWEHFYKLTARGEKLAAMLDTTLRELAHA